MSKLVYSPSDKTVHLEKDGQIKIKWLRRSTIDYHSGHPRFRKREPCPNELHNSGECDQRDDERHCKFHYHFAQLDDDGCVMREKSGKPMCRYSRRYGDNQCWELCGRHDQVFAHHEDEEMMQLVQQEMENTPKIFMGSRLT